MSHPSKRKGDRFEREIVNRINQDTTMPWVVAERARGSDGRALGHTEEVDILVQVFEPKQLGFIEREIRVQAKRRRSIASYLKPPEGTDAVMVREDRGDTLVVMRLDDFLNLLKP